MVLLPSKTGYILTGTCNTPNSPIASGTVLTLSTSVDINHYLEPDSTEFKSSSTCLEALWSMDHTGIHSKEIGSVDKDVLCTFERSIRYSKKYKQYIVKLPWRMDKSILPNNYGIAFCRLNWIQGNFFSKCGIF